MKVFLIGFMGCGKSFVSTKLAEKAGYTAIDLDELIARKAKKSIPQIFAEDGEISFRILEKECLYQLADHQEVIIATGGGTPCFFDNLDWMKKNGLVVYLKANPELLCQRLMGQQANRPLLAGKSKQALKAFIETKLEERQSFYESAAVVYEQRKEGQTVVEELFHYFFGR